NVLLERGADIEAGDDHRHRTPMMHAAQSGHLEVVKVLLKNGANVNATDRGGKTALSLAKWNSTKEIRRLLKAHGARR
ncbi:ankyrin repeat domain-containing protein, partial [Thermodesulfobacteriota bacterium]